MEAGIRSWDHWQLVSAVITTPELEQWEMLH